MSSLKPPSTVEELAGHPLTQGSLTLVGALSGTPLTCLLPVLADTIAAGRQQVRIEAAVKHIEERLLENEQALKNITDSQYKVINETFLILLQTIEDQKIEYLKQVVQGTLDDNTIQP